MVMVLFIHCLITVFEAEFYWAVAPRWLALRSKWSEWVLCIFSRKFERLNYLNLENIREMHIKCCLWCERWISQCFVQFTFCACGALEMWLPRNLSLVANTEPGEVCLPSQGCVTPMICIQVSWAALGMPHQILSLVLNWLWLLRAWYVVPSAWLIECVRVYSCSGKKGHMENDIWWIPGKKSHGKPPNYQGLIASESTVRSSVLRSCGINVWLR